MPRRVEALSTLEGARHMLRGQVYGALAHAGKVRGQIPKIAKEEKKKTSRAKQQMQYNRHLVNVVLTFGNQKSPMPTLKYFVILAL